MAKHLAKDPAEFIVPLNMNGLQGRMLYLPPHSKTKEILFVYGHHSTIERWWGLIEELNKFGAVTVPDLPGFGGMASLYKIGEKPSIDKLADYLAAFIKLRYKRRRLTIVGVSFGFVVVTRMLQLYPDLAKKVDLLVSIAGFTHNEDLKFTAGRKRLYKLTATIMGRPLPAWLASNTAFKPFMLRRIYKLGRNKQKKYRKLNDKSFKTISEAEIALWQNSDVRTHMSTSRAMLSLDNCRVRVDLPVWHVAVTRDKYLDGHLVEQHMRVTFQDFHLVKSKLRNHPLNTEVLKSPTGLIPPKLRRELHRSV